MRIEQLLYLSEISKTHSISLAADNLFISQPAISSAIKKLEDELDVSLLTRSKNGVYLTDIGNHILTEAQALLTHVDQINAIVEQHHCHEYESLPGSLHLHLPPTLNNWLIEEILPDFQSVFPRIILECLEDNPEEIQMHCTDPSYDLHIFSTLDQNYKETIPQQLAVHPDLQIDFLTTCKQIALVGQSSPLAQKSSLSLKDIFQQPLGCLSYTVTDYDFIHRLFPDSASPNIIFRSNNQTLLIDQIRKDKCITVSVPFQPPIPGIVMVPISTPIKVTFFASYYTNTPLLPAIQYFLSLLKNLL